MNIYSMDVDKIQKAFSPTHEIQTPDLFVGRRDEVRKGILALCNPGALMCIFGLRGVGKSSIAHQLALIARGDKALLNMLALERYMPKKGLDFIVHYVRCDDFVTNIVDLVKRIIFADEKGDSLLAFTHGGDTRLESYKQTFSSGAEASAKAVFGASLSGGKVKETTYRPYISGDQILEFYKILGGIRGDNPRKSGLLILVDEFDRIPDKRGFSSLIKTCSDQFVKFGIVGIANNITELVEDHESAGRQFDMIHVPRMPTYELVSILERAQYAVDHLITFTDAVKEKIAVRAEGFPYFVHLLGREAMLLAFETNTTIIGDDILKVLVQRITSGQLTITYEDKYQKVVRNSSQREMVLKAYADMDSDEMSSREVNKTLHGLVVNPYQYTRELATGQGAVLVKVRDDFYRFSDPVFKVYARIRDWKF